MLAHQCRPKQSVRVARGLGLSIAIGGLTTINPATAQIVPDNTLPVNTRVTLGCTLCTIEGGTVRGTNLFHSFSEFSLPTGGEAFFNNALQIQNIFTRVTGTKVSEINGLIRARGTANLFFLNPNGISFGPNARLNIRGSFVVSTASSLEFADGRVFRVTPATPSTSLLTISIPIGLQYGSNPGSIRVRGSRLQVTSGQTFALAGGDVILEGGLLRAMGGRIELAGVTGEGSIGLVTNGSHMSLSVPDSTRRTDVSLTNAALVDVRAGDGGSIAINARNLNMTEESFLVAGIASGRGSVGSKAGNIEINATEAINLNKSNIVNRMQERAVGNGGDINITTESLSLTNGSQLSANTEGQGKAGNVNILARDTVVFDGVRSDRYASGASSQVDETGKGDGGDININTRSLFVTNGAQLIANTEGQGKAGNVNIVAHDTVAFDGESRNGLRSAAGSSVRETAKGDGGDITITTGSLFVTNGAFLSATTRGEGRGGNINIVARDTVTFGGEGSNGGSGGAFSSVQRTGVGNGGNVNITTSSLFVTNGAQLSANIEGQGKAGNVNIVARDTVAFDGVDSNGFNSGAFSNVEGRGAGG